MTTVFVFLLGALAGLIVGFLLHATIFSDSENERQTKRELVNLRREFHEYQQKVEAHFVQGTELMADLQSRAERVQSHIFAGAKQFNRDGSRQSLLQPSTNHVEYGLHAVEENSFLTNKNGTEVVPPRDYATD